MQKEIVNQSEIKLVGLSSRTNNKNDMNPEQAIIGKLMGQFFNENITSLISNRKTPGTLFSVYTEYDSNEHGDYTYFVGEEVSSFDNIPTHLKTLTIPTAKYQKFTTTGQIPEIIINARKQIWNMTPEDFGGKRTYQADFEIYDERARDPQSATLDIYIGIK